MPGAVAARDCGKALVYMYGWDWSAASRSQSRPSASWIARRGVTVLMMFVWGAEHVCSAPRVEPWR